MDPSPFKERRAERLFSSSARRKLGIAAICFLLAAPFMWMSRSPLLEFEDSIIAEERREPTSDPLSLKMAKTERVPEQVKKTIEDLFEEIEKNPDLKDTLLDELKRILQETFAGQEDCWSCEGTAYFDRFDQLAGKGEGRKPMGLREWVDQGDEAYQNQQLDLARKFYSKALQVMDERIFQPDDLINRDLLERLQRRCTELDCR